ncbi:MAG: tetratricopeptide repeat protein, partial [Bacteroidota bacterium]|nr:tetratricopeptide repeat protein [Bacteroidota bacterium]
MYAKNLKSYRPSLIWIFSCCLGLFLQFFTLSGKAQPHLSIELKKPKKYEERTLPAEKSGNKKFTVPRRFYNDLVSRFNYYFNANEKLKYAVEKAKEVHVDDYTQLLSFYNYTLDETAKSDLDSVLYKCTAGILLHDLRSDWVDKLYLLMGKAYLYRKDFDSATNVFQFINYAFAPKDNGYDIPIGSNASNTNGVFTIATRENRSLWKRIASFPPSRNESFLWQARTYIENDELTEAGSLLELVRQDPNFPERLRTDLNELIAYNQYKLQNYAASAEYLEKALGNAGNSLEKARWEYLIAQMHHLAGNDTKAIAFFENSIRHTTDPLMEVYARMNIVSLATANEDNAIQKNLDELLKMAKRDKYAEHRDIIYYAAAQLELKRKGYAAAQKWLLKCIEFSTDNPLQKQLGFLLLGDLNYQQKQYRDSYRFYDSIQTSLLKDEDRERVVSRKPALQIISGNADRISREDSLQHLAALPEAEREQLLKKLLKQRRKEQGLKEEEKDNISFGNTQNPGTTTGGTDMFGSPSGDFYFLNASQKAKGIVAFKSKWGNRPNIDNWRRESDISNSLNNPNSTSPTAEKSVVKPETTRTMSMESLTSDIPLTKAQMDSSNKTIIAALLENAHTFQNQLEDYPSAIETYEELMRRFPESAALEDALFNLSYCYKKAGDPARSELMANQLQQRFGKGKLAEKLANANIPDQTEIAADKQYEKIYGLFLSGNFTEAKNRKTEADKQFGKKYWTPQLLYIESIYYIKQKEDSTAINRLQDIISLFAKSPLAEKAGTMIDVLRRRKEIETYLTNLNLDKPETMDNRRVDL